MAHPNLNTFALSLRGVFADPDAGRGGAIAFMDNYLAQPQTQQDFGLTLRYCTLLAQLSDFLHAKKSSFLKLRVPFSFCVELQSGEYTASCHLVELLTRVVSLSKQCCKPVMVALRIHEDGPMASGDAWPLLVTTDLDMEEHVMTQQFSDIRACIGLLHYCVYTVLPYAAYVVRLLDQHSGTVKAVYFYYSTLRSLGSWIAAAIRFRAVDGAIATGRPYDVMMHRAGTKSLQECMLIADDVAQSQHPVTKFMGILRESSAYEVDLRRARNMLLQSPHTSQNTGIACCVFKRAQSMKNSRAQPDDAAFNGSPVSPGSPAPLAYTSAEADAFFAQASREASLDRSVLKRGNSPLTGTVFA
jgi:hypothetical protein